MLFYVDTLEHLRRGGRIGAAAALFGTALAVKPLLHVTGGQIAPLEKVRTASKALARLEELAVQRAGDGPVDLAVHHLAAPATTTPVRRPSARPALEAPGFPDPTALRSTPRRRASSTAGDTVPTR